MPADYTPTMERIAQMYSWAYAWRTDDDVEGGDTDLSAVRASQRAEFDRALAAHDTQLQQQTLNNTADTIDALTGTLDGGQTDGPWDLMPQDPATRPRHMAPHPRHEAHRMTPKRIQMTRQHPWRTNHPNAIIVTRPTKWGNPYTVTGKTETEARQVAINMYRQALEAGKLTITPTDIRHELAGQDLACWCPLDQPCHADVLLELANP